jgi:hypothetical protein
MTISLVACTGCGKYGLDLGPPRLIGLDTVATTIGTYHGTFVSHGWTWISSGDTVTVDTEFVVTEDATIHNGINFLSEEHVRINSDLTLYSPTTGVQVQYGRIVLGDSIYLDREAYAPGHGWWHRIAAAKNH